MSLPSNLPTYSANFQKTHCQPCPTSFQRGIEIAYRYFGEMAIFQPSNLYYLKDIIYIYIGDKPKVNRSTKLEGWKVRRFPFPDIRDGHSY
jgi:hypothetical protein